MGILPKRISKLKNRALEDNVMNITRSGKHYKLSFLERDHPYRNMEEGSKPVELQGKEGKEEEDRVLIQLKKTQAHVSVRGLLASHKHCQALSDTLKGKEVPNESSPQEMLALTRVEAQSNPFLTFPDEEHPSEEATHTKPLQIIIKCMSAKVLIVLIDNGSILNVCPFRTTLIVSLDLETITPSLLNVRAYENTSRKVMGTFKAS